MPSSRHSKEKTARKIAERDGITEGLICLLSCVEPCRSYAIRRDRQQQRLVLEPRQRKCLHIYRYWIDPVFGFMSARVQTWFPFAIQICVNGREWLARQLDKIAVNYQRLDNCFVWLQDWQLAQKVMDQQLRFDWPTALGLIACQVNPILPQILGEYPAEYYWTVHQSEWATDLMFGSPRALAEIYPRLVRAGEVVSDYKRRPEGIRVKHWMGKNSIKMYDKHGRALRVESTVNDPRPFKVFRPAEGNPDGPRSWRPMRRGIADLQVRAQLSQASNQRYLQGLASLDTQHPMQQLIDPLCGTTVWKGRRERSLRPWSKQDRLLLQTISRGEFVLNGFRNRDLVPALFPGAFSSAAERARAAARVTRKLLLLRAHGVIRKAGHSDRYFLTKKGRAATTAIFQYATVTLDQLPNAAA